MATTEKALIVGGGSIGRRHIQNLQQLNMNVAVVEQAPEVRRKLSTEFELPMFANLSNGLNSEDPDIVVVCTPNRFHVEIAIEAARAGCHLFVEKPLSDRMEGITELQSVVSEQNIISLVGCNLRFHPEIKKIHELLENNIVGPVVAARIEGGSYLPEWFPDTDYRESYSAREDLGGGVILDYIHEINYAQWFFDDFEEVSAMTGQQSQLEIETNDVAGILAKTSEGTICEFHLDYVQREYSRSCHIIGEKGTIRWSWSDEQVDWYISNDDTWFSFQRPDDWNMNKMYLEEMRHFLSCVQANKQTTCPIECGKSDLAVALAAREASQSKSHMRPDRYE